VSAWADLGAAVSGICIFEGLLPLLEPASMKRTLMKLVAMDERRLRFGGFVFVVSGLLLLFLVRP
jgi:uncharacterized protein YjeT (DUF2065 family)